jgi:hypothetical protein
MDSVTQIYNMAIIECGSDAVLAPTDDNRQSRLCNARYPDALEATLRAHFWNCAMVRETLNRLTAQPASGFEFAYQLPASCLRAKSIDSDDEWRIEGRTLVTDCDSVVLLYASRITDVSKMDPLLCQAIALKLASSIAYAIKGDHELSGRLLARWQDMLAEARFIDANEGNFDRITPTAFTDARSTGPAAH